MYKHLINNFLSFSLPLPPSLPSYCYCHCYHYFRAFQLYLTPSTISFWGKLLNFMTSYCPNAPCPWLAFIPHARQSSLYFSLPNNLSLVLFSSYSSCFPWANSYVLILSVAIDMLINPMFSAQPRRALNHGIQPSYTAELGTSEMLRAWLAPESLSQLP